MEISKKQLRQMVETTIGGVLRSLKISKPSRKTRNVIGKISRKLSEQIRGELKKQGKKRSSKPEPAKKPKPVSKKTKTG